MWEPVQGVAAVGSINGETIKESIRCTRAFTGALTADVLCCLSADIFLLYEKH